MSNILISPPPTTLLTGLLQLSGGVAISSTPVYVTDQNNTASPLALATANVNVNTTSGSALVNIKGTGTTSSSSSLIVQNSAGTNVIQALDNTNVYFAKAIRLGGTSIYDVSGYMSMFNSGNSARIGPEHFSTDSSSWYADASGSRITLSYLGYGLINNNWLVGSGASNTARLSVKGSGSTSATTNTLKQNSSGTQLFKLTDDGKVTIGNGTTGTALLDVSVGAGSTPPLRLKGYSDAGTSYLISAGTESFQDGFKVKMVNGNVTMGTQLNGYTFGLETFNGVAMHIANAGNIGMGTTSPNVSAKLDVNSTTQGFLPPVMTTAQKTAIGSPSKGLIVFDSSLNKLCVYNGGAWETITSV